MPSALVHGLRGADTHTGRVGAVVTARHLKMAASVRVEAGFNVFHPGAAHPQGHFVLLRFAGDGTGVAANTFAVVDDKTVVLGLISRDGNVSWSCALPFWVVKTKRRELRQPSRAAGKDKAAVFFVHFDQVVAALAGQAVTLEGALRSVA